MAAPSMKNIDIQRLRRLRFSNVILCMIGVLIAFYAIYVKILAENNSDYVALCDLHEKVSCSKVIGSRYGKGFGILGSLFGEDSILNQANSLYGIAFYVFHLCLDLRVVGPLAVQLQVTMSVAANLMSVYLAYLLAFVLHDVCLICVATYLVNALLLVIDFKKLKLIQKNTASKPTNRPKKSDEKVKTK